MTTTPTAPPAFWQVEITVPAAAVAGLEAALEPVSEALLCFETNEEKGLWTVQALCEERPAPSVLQPALALIAASLGIDEPEPVVIRLEGRDWLRENLVTFPPIRVGRFFIHGSHHTAPPPSGSFPLQVDAATAFGSGDHDSTRGCLMALDMLDRRGGASRVLDMGCGSGILSLAAARAWPCSVLAVDIDPESVRVAKANARLNGLAHRITAMPGNGPRGREVREDAPYDLICANILARPLAAMAKPLASLLAPGGTVVLAGLLERQERAVLSAYRTQGLTLLKRLRLNPWTTLVLRG